MTRKILLSIILIIVMFFCYELGFGENETLREKVASIKQLEASSNELDSMVAQLEKKTTTDFDQKKKKLEEVIEQYNESKDEYDELVAKSEYEIDESMLEPKDIYDVDFLWTIVGNYATEEGINLKFDINKNTTSASSINNTSGNYVVCDLKFTITGNYINLTDFIYDIEDDDRLNFEINDFTMQKSGEELQVNLNVREIKVNSDNLIATGLNTNSQTSTSTQTQNINASTTNTVNGVN